MKFKLTIIVLFLSLFFSDTVFASSLPKNFLWGAATSAHQTEGGNIDTDWMRAEKAGKIKNGDTTLRADDGYNLAFSDIKLIKDLGLNSYRFSIEWARVEPEKGKFNQEALDHYRKLILDLKANNIEPIVTLHHFTTPGWAMDKGGWTNREIAGDFAEYTSKVVEMNKNDVNFWITINEPTVFLSKNYLETKAYPYKRNLFLYYLGLKNAAEAHRRAYDIIHSKNENAKVAVAYQFFDIVPKRDNWLETKIAQAANYFFNWLWMDRVQDKLDYVGVNYYQRFYVGLGFPLVDTFYKRKDTTDFNWNIEPEGLGHIALQISQRYKKPIMITENGLADKKDEKRTQFIKNHIESLKSANGQGANIIGYMHWSLMDNFEWQFKGQGGYDVHFGLYEVDMKTFERKPRPSALFYRDLIKENQR